MADSLVAASKFHSQDSGSETGPADLAIAGLILKNEPAADSAPSEKLI